MAFWVGANESGTNIAACGVRVCAEEMMDLNPMSVVERAIRHWKYLQLYQVRARVVAESRVESVLYFGSSVCMRRSFANGATSQLV